jgi:hypothetical protein
MVKIRVAKLDFCYDGACSFSENLHLTVAVEEVELEESQAVAISYTWGQFERENVSIGHVLRESNNPVSMELGREWEIRDLISTLAAICIENRGHDGQEEHGSVWIDQLCIPQNTRGIRTELAKIPSIYRTLHVVVLMPGGLCGCLSHMDPSLDAVSRFDYVLSRNHCFNALGSCSYFSRQWTRQELLFSRSVQIRRTSSEMAPCVRSHTDAHLLTSFSRLLFEQLEDGENWSDVLMGVRTNHIDFVIGMSTSMQECGLDLWELYDFFSGQRIEKPATEQGEGRRLLNFLDALVPLGRSKRMATKSRDYVLSVWVDCPGYRIPENFRDMELADLLEDAILQLEHNHGKTIRTTAVAGLFGDLRGCATWRPTAYLRYFPSPTCNQIYSVVQHMDSMPIRPDGVTLLYATSRQISLGQRARRYTDVFHGQNGAIVANALEPVVATWSRTARTNAMVQLPDPGAEAIDDTYILTRFLLRSVGIRTHIHGENPYAQWEEVNPAILTFIDHHNAVYTLVSRALGLEPEICRNVGLELMVVLDRYPCIGFTRGEPGAAQDMITISTGTSGWDTENGYGELFYEAINQEEPSRNARYRVCGVWVPGRIPGFRPDVFVVPEGGTYTTE